VTAVSHGETLGSMQDLARAAIGLMPPDCRFQPADAEAIRRHQGLLLACEPGLVRGFYDLVYGHAATAAVFVEGERPAREATLVNWWRRTAEGPLDDDYFAWMAMVGLVHVVRDVGNPMMLAMAGFVADFVAGTVASAGLDPADAEALTGAVRRLTSTAGAIITFGYDRAVVSALFSVAGMPAPLLRRLRDQEVAAVLASAREQLPSR